MVRTSLSNTRANARGVCPGETRERSSRYRNGRFSTQNFVWAGSDGPPSTRSSRVHAVDRASRCWTQGEAERQSPGSAVDSTLLPLPSSGGLRPTTEYPWHTVVSFEIFEAQWKKIWIRARKGSSNALRQRERITLPSDCRSFAPSARRKNCDSIAPCADAKLPRGSIDSGTIPEARTRCSSELGVKLAPRTPKAGYSKLTFWHTDGTKNGEPANANLGPSGWGFFLKLEQELTADGRLIGIARYGRSFNDSAAYKQLASGHLLLYDPSFIGRIRNDLVGIAFNWAEVPVSAARSEYNVEAFYRFPIFPSVDMTLSYQSVINPALDRDNDHASVFSLRLRTTF